MQTESEMAIEQNHIDRVYPAAMDKLEALGYKYRDEVGEFMTDEEISKFEVESLAKRLFFVCVFANQEAWDEMPMPDKNTWIRIVKETNYKG